MIRVISPGLQATIQDLGRKGYLADGVPEAGAVDPAALRVANRLAGNPEEAAGLEMPLLGAVLRAEADLVFAVTGADLGPTLDGEPVPMWQAVPFRRGQTLRFAGLRSGCRAYLAVAGGIAVPPVLGSRSTDTLGKLGPAPLAAGDLLPVGVDRLPDEALRGRRLPLELRPDYPAEIEVRAVSGPQADRFAPEALTLLTGAAWTVQPRSDRMGCRLDGPSLPHLAGADIISDGMPLGGIQVPPDGKPIVLLQGRQTMGGYTKIAVVISPDVGRIAQLPPGGRLRISLIDRAQAHLLARVTSDHLALLLGACGQP